MNEHDDRLGETHDETFEVVAGDEPSMEDYPFMRVSRCWCLGPDCVGEENIPLDEFCFQAKQQQPQVRDGVRDTRSR